MYRLLLILSLLPIAAALAARWWFGARVLAEEGGRACRADLAHWPPAPGDTSAVHRAEGCAGDFGSQLRLKALADWREAEPKAAASRESTRRFGVAVPPLSALVAIMAVLVGKLPVLGVIAIFLTATAISAMFGLLTLAPELAAITRAARHVRQARSFPDNDEMDAVVRCAHAHAWDAALPPVLRMFHKKKLARGNRFP